jgi:hypothetical protein
MSWKDLAVSEFARMNPYCLSPWIMRNGRREPRSVNDVFSDMFNSATRRMEPRHRQVTEDGTPNTPFWGIISEEDVLLRIYQKLSTHSQQSIDRPSLDSGNESLI